MIFDDVIVSNYQDLAREISEGRDDVKIRLETSTTIDNQTKKLLRYLSHTSLDTLSLLCNLTAFNMALINNIDTVIDNLPQQFHNIKTKFRYLVNVTKDQHDFDTWAKKIADGLSEQK